MLPGREVRLGERPMFTAEQIVEGLHTEVGPRLGETPFAIFGHSMGTLLGLEWARRIAADGLPGPKQLFVSGRNAPQALFPHRGLHRLGDEAFVAELNTRYGGLPDGFLDDDELRGVFLPILRADITVVETYEFQAGERLRCPIMGFAGIDDQSVSEVGLEAWREITAGEFSWRRFSGDHFYHLGSGKGELLAAVAGTLG
jgi:surfactin synthase thioesterase subunit